MKFQKKINLYVKAEVGPGLRQTIAHKLRLNRSSLYLNSNLQDLKDHNNIEILKHQHQLNPFYGRNRLAVSLGWSTKKTARIMSLAEVEIPKNKPPNRRQHARPQDDLNPPNHFKPYLKLKDETQPHKGSSFSSLVQVDFNVWSQDFTTFKCGKTRLYLAVIIDVKSKLLMGYSLQLSHSKALVVETLKTALKTHAPPKILHSDQGVEYLSKQMLLILKAYKIELSCSDAGSPYQNPYVESWFSNFKREVDLSTSDLGVIYANIVSYIHYYNYQRIHTALKTTPHTRFKQLNSPKPKTHS